jgi:hypothetical protein
VAEYLTKNPEIKGSNAGTGTIVNGKKVCSQILRTDLSCRDFHRMSVGRDSGGFSIRLILEAAPVDGVVNGVRLKSL